MKTIKSYYKQFESLFGSMKFAVVIIGLFTIALVYGTFMESYHGADYANRLVYKSWWFILIQICMFISIVVATIVRLPMKKRLYGFYTIHLGLITLFVGSLVTYINGIDGSLELMPNTPSRKVIINEDFLKVSIMSENKAIKFPLPYTAFQTKMNGNYKDFIKVTDYIPSAKLETYWEKSNLPKGTIDHGSTYMIFNQNLSQEFTLALNPGSDFKSSQTLGLLNLHYMPKTLYSCFIQNSKSGYLIWNTELNTCFTPEQKKLTITKTDKGSEFILYKYKGEDLKFFPNFSPLPVNDDLTKRTDSPFRVFSRNLFTEKPHLFLFGDKVAFYKKRKKSWVGHEFNQENTLIKLPWMQFQLRLLTHHEGMTPYQRPVFTKPIQDKSEIIEGDIQAVKVNLNNNEFWVRSDAPLAVANGTSQIRFQLVKKELNLPYQITLSKFKMKTNPGTNTPASYESFVDLLDGRNTLPASEHHVFMNNPLKYDDFTFYQSSYFQVGPDMYGSVFSVNYDPGRPIKYLGSFLLVFGSIWHYIIRRKRKKSPAKAKQESSLVPEVQNA